MEKLVELIHASPLKMSLCICGAGSGAIQRLTSAAGCSNSLVEAQVYYHPTTTAHALAEPRIAHMVSPAVARQLAQHAYLSGCKAVGHLTDSPPSFVGVGATSAIQTNRQRKGKDRVYVSVWGLPDNGEVVVRDYHAELSPDLGRGEQDKQVEELILRAIALAASVTVSDEEAASALSSLAPVVEGSSTAGPWPLHQHAECETDALISAVESSRTSYVLWNERGEARSTMAPYVAEVPAATSDEGLQLLYPGSFNPLHWGHTELAQAALRVAAASRPLRADAPVPRLTYEISVKVVDKGRVCREELRHRLAQFHEHGRRVAITATPLFIEKAALFPRHGFIIGVDTARRIVTPHFYSDAADSAEVAEKKMVRALLDGIGQRGCYFVVGGRVGDNGAWEDLSSIAMPEALRPLFIGIPEKEFRVDISSTELRARR